MSKVVGHHHFIHKGLKSMNKNEKQVLMWFRNWMEKKNKTKKKPAAGKQGINDDDDDGGSSTKLKQKQKKNEEEGGHIIIIIIIQFCLDNESKNRLSLLKTKPPPLSYCVQLWWFKSFIHSFIESINRSMIMITLLLTI